MTKTLALILAAGRGTRAGEGLPKTYREVNGMPVIRHSVLTFLQNPRITTVQVVIHQSDLSLYQESMRDLNLPDPVYGGENRAESVSNGIKNQQDFDKILIHDGARPFVTRAVIDRVLDALEINDGAIPGLPVTNALWSTNNKFLLKPVPRENLIAAQTPQGFDFKKYKAIAHKNNVRDDAEAAIEAGLKVVYVEGCQNNHKLTYPEDFQ